MAPVYIYNFNKRDLVAHPFHAIPLTWFVTNLCTPRMQTGGADELKEEPLGVENTLWANTVLASGIAGGLGLLQTKQPCRGLSRPSPSSHAGGYTQAQSKQPCRGYPGPVLAAMQGVPRPSPSSHAGGYTQAQSNQPCRGYPGQS